MLKPLVLMCVGVCPEEDPLSAIEVLRPTCVLFFKVFPSPSTTNLVPEVLGTLSGRVHNNICSVTDREIHKNLRKRDSNQRLRPFTKPNH